MSWEQDKAVYIDKLRRVNAGIDEITRLEGNQIVTPAMEDKLRGLRTQSRGLLDKLENDEFEIAVVGLESAGKSYFANALTNLNALPTADERCTYTATCIRPGTENVADVVFYTEQEFTRDLQEKLQKLTIPDSSRYTLDNLTLARYKQLYENTPDSIKAQYGTTLHEDILDTLKNAESLREYIGRPKEHFLEEDLGTPSFTGFITDPRKAIAVKDVTIYSTELGRMLSGTGSGELNAVLYDVPGFNSPTAMHEEQTLEKMDHADVIIMVAKAHEPSLESAVLDIFDKPDADGHLMKDKLFVFANKADWATDLEKNKAKTYDEWINARRILPKEHKSRIIFGSAKAALGDEDARASLSKKGATDGMDEMRSKLVSYYTTDRFNVLRHRIDKILFDVDQIFKDAKERFGPAADAPGGQNRSAYNRLLLRRETRLKDAVHQALVQLKADVNEEARTVQPLTEGLRNCIEDIVQQDKYALDDETIDRIHIDNAGVGAAEQPVKINGLAREKRFEEMYSAFTSDILSSTRSRHQDVREEIVRIFMDAMEPDPQFTDVLREEVIRFCGLGDLPQDVEDVYYQSLIERFARDVFEVQIKFVPGPDRLHKFQEEAANFFSLGVFFNARRSKDDDDPLGYVGRTPAQSALWRLLLYPSYAAVLADDAPQRKVLALTGLSELDATSKRLLEQVVNAKGPKVLEALDEAFDGVVVGKTQANDMVHRVLQDILDDEEQGPEDILDGAQYLLDMAEWQKDYSYKKVQSEFSDDIDALRMVLKHAFVPAVHVDKAFSARESKLIEDIVARLDSDEFLDFVSRNFSMIAASDIRGYEREEAQRHLNMAVMREIQNILDKISGSGAARPQTLE